VTITSLCQHIVTTKPPRSCWCGQSPLEYMDFSCWVWFIFVIKVFTKVVWCNQMIKNLYLWTHANNLIRVMLHIIPLSSFCPPKFDVTLKIIIEFMIDHYWISKKLSSVKSYQSCPDFVFLISFSFYFYFFYFLKKYFDLA